MGGDGFVVLFVVKGVDVGLGECGDVGVFGEDIGFG